MQEATKCELERIVNDISHPKQIVLAKQIRSDGYNLRSQPCSVAIQSQEGKDVLTPF